MAEQPPDEDDPVFLDVEELPDPVPDAKSKRDLVIKRNTVMFVDKRQLFNFDVSVYSDSDGTKAISPFGSLSDAWMADCISKGRNIDSFIDRFCDSFVPPRSKVRYRSLVELNKQGIESSLKYTSNLYHNVSKINDQELVDKILEIEKTYRDKEPYFFSRCGEFIEHLVRLIEYESKSDNRRSTCSLDTQLVDRSLNS